MSTMPDKAYTDLFVSKSIEVLKNYRDRKGLKQENVAPLFGIERTRFSRLENNKRMKLETFAALLKVYEIPLSKFAFDLAHEIQSSAEKSDMRTDVIEKIVKFINPPKSASDISPKPSRPPKPPLIFNENTQKWELPPESKEMMYEEPISMPLEERFDYERCKKDFETYLLSEDAVDKCELLIRIENMCITADKKGVSLSKEKKSFIKASLKYIASHPDPYLREEFKAYLKMTEKQSTGLWSHLS